MITRTTAAFVLATALVCGACGSARDGGASTGGNRSGGGSGSGPDLSGLDGAIEIDGSSTVFPVSQLAAQRFAEEASNVEIAVGFAGTGGGFERFCNGETHIQDASRPIEEDEARACEDSGVEYVELLIGLDGLTNVVHPENAWATCLTVEQLKTIWEKGSKVKTWQDVDPSFPENTLGQQELFGAGPDSGTYDFFLEEVIGDPDEGAAMRTEYNPSEDDNALVQGVAGEPNALGFFGFAYYQESADQLKAVELDGGDGCVAPTVETIEDGSYFLSRPLFIYVDTAALGEEHVRAFVQYYLDHVEDLVTEAGYVQPAAETLDETRAAFEAALG